MRRVSQYLLAFAAVFPLFFGASQHAHAVNVRVTLGLNQDGVRSTAYPCVLADRSDCAPPTTGTLSCNDAAAPALTGLPTGSAYSADVRQFFSGTAAATATLSVVSVSGDDAATNGWAISSAGAGNNLTNAGSNAGAGALKVRGTSSGNSVDCSVRNWSLAAAPGAESVAGTIITGLTYTPGDNSVTVAGDAPSDPPPSASRIKQVNLRFNGTGATTAVSVGGGLSRALTQQIIGSSDGTPASTQSGTGLSLGFGGSGVDSTADNVLAFTDTTGLAGDAFATVTVASITSAASFPKAGIRVAESNVAGAKAVYCYFQNSATKKVQCKTRATDNVATVSQVNQTVTGTLSLRLTRTAATNTFAFDYSTDGGTNWTAGATFTISMASTLYWGAFITSTSAGTNATASLSNWNLNNVSRWSYVKSTASTVTVDATSQDNDDNVSAYSGSITAIPTAVPQKKWHPGHYMGILRGTADLVQSARFSKYDDIAANTAIEGVNVFFRWTQLEAERGNYASGITLIQSELAKLKCQTNPAPGCIPKRLIITVHDQAYNGTCPAASYLPAYLNAASKLIQLSHDCIWKRWDSEAMGWFIDMMNAYAAAFDNEPYVEIIRSSQETSIAWGTTTKPADWSEAAYDSQLRRLSLALVTAWPKTNVWMPLNWGVSTTRLQGLISYFSSIKVGTGNPDVCPSCGMAVDLIAIGSSGGHDYRGEMPILMQVETSTLGVNAVGPDGGFTSAQIFSYVNGTQQASHLIWDRNNFAGNANQQWLGASGELATINANSLTHTSCPSVYTQGCDTN